MKKSLTIQELLHNRGLSNDSNVKLVRHKDPKINIYEMYRLNKTEFLKYQSEQSKDVFKGLDTIVSFIGEAGTLARFVGVYQVISTIKIGNNYKYNLKEISGFEDIKERVIIEWGKATQAWHQLANQNEKEIIEILPKNTFNNKEFISYEKVILDFKDLHDIIKGSTKFKDWCLMLSAVNGIYLILDKKTGKQYVGAAYGDSGIWGRWTDYVKNGHGNNDSLKKLIKKDKDYAKKYFQFTILSTLPKTLTNFEVIEHEIKFKKKLGTIEFGLNGN